MEDQDFDISDVPKNEIVGLFGDFTFPRSGAGYDNNKKRNATQSIINILNTIKPKLVYLIPSKGVNLYCTFALSLLNIPYILVTPHNKYYLSLSAKDRKRLIFACKNSKTLIALSDGGEAGKFSSKMHEAVEYISNSSGVMLGVSSRKPTEEFIRQMDIFTDNDKLCVWTRYR